MKTINPGEFGLSARNKIVEIDHSRWALIIHRKTRLIMADGIKILDKINQIKSFQSGIDVSLKTDAPLCSKTRNFLQENGIKIEEL